MSRLDYFIPESFKERRIAYQAIRMILKIDIGVIIFSLLFVAVFAKVGFDAGMYIMAFSFFMAVLFFPVVYFTANPTVIGNFFAVGSFIVFMGMISQTGAMNSPFLIWLATMPPVAILSLPTRHGFLWSFLCAAGFILLLVMQQVGYAFPQNMPAELFPYFQLFSYSLVTTLFVFVVYTYRKSYRKVKNKLKDANEGLKASNSDLDRFASIASHDLKSPLRSIVSFAGLMELKYSENMPEEGREFLQVISNSARHMNNLIEDILEYSKGNSYEPKKVKLDLNRLLSTTVTEIKMNKGYEDVDIVYSSLPVLYTDPTWMKQLFHNLIFNGLKYNKSEHRKVTVNYQEKADGLLFEISDNGIGIAKEHQEKIFEMFKRLHGKGAYEGTGSS